MTAILYSSKTCSKCPTAKKFLTSRGVQFEERDVDNHYDEVVSLGVSQFPIIVIKDKVIAGFNLSELMPILNS